MAYGFRPDSGRICMMCVIVGRSRTEYIVLRTTEVEHGVLELSKSGQNGKRGRARISTLPLRIGSANFGLP